MSLNLPARRAVRLAANLAGFRSPSFGPRFQRRTAFFSWGSKKTKPLDSTVMPKNPLAEEYLKKRQAPSGSLKRGDLAPSSIFKGDEEDKPASGLIPRNPETMAAALDPNPRTRLRWQQKMVIRDVRKRGRMSRAQLVKRQERVLLSKSHDFKTSVKKLGPLARQIAGKTVEDAIIQMRFSKKKAAKEVKAHLEHAKNEAIVRRGMALGKLNESDFTPVNIQTKDKKTVKVVDPTSLYVDEAWVGRGLYTTTPDYRARGQTNIMKNPTTSISVVLKEEKTRIRQHEERQKKIRNRKVWTQLPNRPITTQRQYYSW